MKTTVVLCLGGRSASLTADRLRQEGFQVKVATGPTNLVDQLGRVTIKNIYIVTDSIVCARSVCASSAVGNKQIIFWGEDPEREADRLVKVKLSEHTDLAELIRTLRRLENGQPIKPDSPGSPSRLRRR